MHKLIDKLFETDEDLKAQNSFMFHLKISMILSTMVQMKNSLVKYLDYEVNEENEELNFNFGFSQKPAGIFDQEDTQNFDMSVMTPIDVVEGG